jgi:CRISPR-associated protein Csx10
MKYQIKIELLSDLCSESGASLSESVDTDVCTDAKGYPYLPAKRLKGILLEAFLDYLDVTGSELKPETYFGVEDGMDSSMYLSDATLDEESRKKGLSGDYEKVKKSFVYSRTQTSIDDRNGIAKEGSLRTINVVSAGVNFEFDVTTSLDEKTLKDVLSLVRHMGGKRTRGLGEVRWTLAKVYSASSTSSGVTMTDAMKDYQVSLLLRSANNLLIPAGNKNETLSYIPGSSIYGFFANRYIRDHQLTDPMQDPDFLAMFIDHKVRFSNGYLSDSKGTEFLPLPSLIAKVKNTKKYKNGIYKDPNLDSSLNTDVDNNPKTKPRVKAENISEKYGTFDGTTILFAEPQYSFDYHHARDKAHIGDGTISDAQFYQYYSLSAGQYFLVTLQGQGQYLEKLLKGLTEIRVGKSRTAQYGCLEIVGSPHAIALAQPDSFTAQEFVVFVESPLILMDDNGNYQADTPAFKNALCQKLQLAETTAIEGHIRGKLISGFNMLWKKSKIAFYGIDNGSYFIVTLPSGSVSLPTRLSLGQKQAEGFGSLRLMALDKLKETEFFTINLPEEEVSIAKADRLTVFENSQQEGLAVCEELKIYDAFNSSTLNRFLLMLQESKDYHDFHFNYIGSVKDDDKKGKFDKVFKRFDELAHDESKPIDYRAFFQTLLASAKYHKRGE